MCKISAVPVKSGQYEIQFVHWWSQISEGWFTVDSRAQQQLMSFFLNLIIFIHFLPFLKSFVLLHSIFLLCILELRGNMPVGCTYKSNHSCHPRQPLALHKNEIISLWQNSTKLKLKDPIQKCSKFYKNTNNINY